MKSHELANRLLAGPDVEVVGLATGQGSGEGENEELTLVLYAQIGYLDNPRGEVRAWLGFGYSADSTEQRLRDGGNLTDA